MKVRATLLALGALLAFTTGADAQARPPAQKTGPVTILGTGSTGDVSAMSVPSPSTSAAAGTLSNLLANRLSLSGNDLSGNDDKSISDKIPFANTGAKHFLYSKRTGPANALLGTTAIVRNTVGSGFFGPGAADWTLFLSSVKDGWDTATGSAAIEGELDAQIVVARQGKKGDAAAYIADVLKRRDNLGVVAPDETGGAGILEGNLGLVDATGHSYQRMHGIIGLAESPAGASQGLGYGGYMETRAGTWFSAYHAGSLLGQADETGQIVPNAWKYYFTGAQNRDINSFNYLVDNTGRTFSGFPGQRMSWGVNGALNSLTFLNDATQQEVARLQLDGGGMTLKGAFTALTLSDTTANSGQRLTSAGDGSFVYQVQTAPNFGGAATVYSITAAGKMTIVDLAANGRLVIPVATPGTSGAACTPGQMSSDASYVYVCVATNSWKRAALSAW
jgi:hypothetical protein